MGGNIEDMKELRNLLLFQVKSGYAVGGMTAACVL